jgi:hypothetical protein
MRYTLGIALDDQESPTREEAVRERMLRQAMAKGPPIDAEQWPRVADVMSRWFREVRDKRGSEDHAELHFKHGLALVIAGIRSEASDRHPERSAKPAASRHSERSAKRGVEESAPGTTQSREP